VRIGPDGRVSSRWQYTGVGREAITTDYRPDGIVDTQIYTVPAVLNGDSVRETRVIYFKLDAPLDTAFVQHFYQKNSKSLKEVRWSFDANGRHPVPADWKFSR
jgi:hypothetical protein